MGLESSSRVSRMFSGYRYRFGTHCFTYKEVIIMRRKSLRTCVLLLGLLLGTASSAYADAISITSVTLSNFQLVPTSGTIVFFSPRTRALSQATNNLGQQSQQLAISESLTTLQTSAGVTFASASAVADPVNSSASQNSNAVLLGCDCEALAVGQTLLQKNFIITGGTGNVDIHFSALLVMTQTLMTDQFGLLASSNVIAGMHLVIADGLVGIGPVFPSVFTTLTIGPNGVRVSNIERQLSETVTLQFNTEYRFDLQTSASSLVVNQAPAEIPEPATVVLLVSGLGFMAGYKKRRALR